MRVKKLLDDAVRKAAEARAVIDGLGELTLEERELWLRGEGRGRHSGLDLALVVHASRALDEGAETACEWATLAEIVLPPEEYELRAVTAAIRANALRARGEMAEAEKLFSLAYELLGSFPVKDRLNRAKVHLLHASYLLDLRRLDEAEEAIRKAYASYRLHGAAKDRALCRIKFGMIAHYRGDYVTSAGFYYLALEEGLRRATEPRPYLAARLNLAINLVLLGRARDAADILARDADLYDSVGWESLSLMRRFLEAQIAETRGLFDHAAGEYEAIFDRFRETGQALNAAQAALYLVRTHLATGRFTAAREAAEAAYEVFSHHEVDREALAALALVAEAARQEALTIETVDTVARGLHVLVYANPPAGPS